MQYAAKPNLKITTNLRLNTGRLTGMFPKPGEMLVAMAYYLIISKGQHRA